MKGNLINSVCYSLIALLLVFTTHAFGQVKVAGVFGDHMVLQRGMPVPIWGWSQPGEQITVNFNKQKQSTVTREDGRWEMNLPAMKAGGPFSLNVNGSTTVVFRDVYIGDVWLCSGQSNMDMTVAREDRYWCGVFNEAQEVATANYPLIRVFDVPFHPTDTLQANVISSWEICSPNTVGHFSATAFFFARELYNRYKIPIGLITSAYGASTAEAWTSNEKLQSHPQLKFLLEEYAAKCNAYDTSKYAQEKYKSAYEKWKTESIAAIAAGKDKPREPKNPDPKKDQHSPAVLFNGMVAPLIPFAIKGAIWYQGESNGPTAKIYDKLMQALIENWRVAWRQGDFPFLYVQLANHQALIDQPVKDDPMVVVREMQLKNLSIANTGMVVAIDNANPGDPNDIHPKNKQEIGKRLALLARAKVYGEKNQFSGPLYSSMVIENNAIRISFNHVGKSLVIKGDILKGFAIAGQDGKFVWADARIEGKTIVVSSSTIARPVAVRYAWAKNPQANLFNDAGLPASPFRTDIE
ncbi:sialate O-acetylesterase [Pseudochryseolinea flava]|uniref:Sialate O-acetylesterase n=1 Tax=Pseudochryseolinea flava TaxID=2059302 RepID=A0A364Y474_9BACT|nr:sialate O-acetylesterase [Pseudochryseolinea flava]RAW00988.1 sialate O-acetylesterase [Pseudochryseolinea flava]